MTAPVFERTGFESVDPTSGAVAANHSCAPRSAGNDLTLDLIEGVAGFHALERDWQALELASAQPHQIFLSFNWMWHWLKHFHDPDADQIVLLTGRRCGRLIMLWPMLRCRIAGVRVLKWMGAPVSPYAGALVEPGPDSVDDLCAALQFLKRKGRADTLELANIRHEPLLSSALERTRGAAITREESAYSLDLGVTDGQSGFKLVQSTKAQKNRRRQRRRLEEHGEVRFECCSEGPRASSLTAAALELKRAWIKSNGLASMAFSSDGFDEFFTTVAASTERPTGCKVFALSVGERAAAIAVGFACKGHLAVHIIAHDPAVEACSPGSLLIEDILNCAGAAGLSCFDLMWPGAAYKAAIAPNVTPVRSYVIPSTLLGSLHSHIVPPAYNVARTAYRQLGPGARKLALRMLRR